MYRGGFLVPPEERESLIRMARATKTDDPEVAFKDDNYRTYLSAARRGVWGERNVNADSVQKRAYSNLKEIRVQGRSQGQE